MLRSMFNIGHAGPLDVTRIRRPRIGRGEDARQPRDIDRSCPRTRQIREQEQSTNKTQTQPIRVRELSMSALSPRPQARLQTIRIREHIAVSTVREQASSADTNCPQTVRSLELSTSAHWSRTRILREPRLAKNCPRWGILVSTSSPARSTFISA